MSEGVAAPGLIEAEAAAAACDHDSNCITCGDVALEMSVVELDAERGLALCETDAGERETVEVALIDEPAVGDRLLVHAATAIAAVDAEAEEAGA